MRSLKIFKQSVGALLSNKGRSFLTVLGIIIGIAAVIALMSLGSGAKVWITERISTLGTANITVMPGADTEGEGPMGHGPGPGGGLAGTQQSSTLTEADLRALEAEVGENGIVAVTGNMTNTAVLATTSGDERFGVVGTSSAYFQMLNREIARGAAYADEDVAARSRVVVLGEDVAREVFGDAEPVGDTLQIAGETYTVVAVLARADENAISDPNVQAFIPYTAAQDTFGTDRFTSFVVQAGSEDEVDAAKAEVTATLLAAHGMSDPELTDFNVKSSQDLLETVNSITDMLTAFLAGIAAISLLVGGIGIMNIMLVSVTERTREIGLRKAVGAKTRHILGQFLTEALLLTLAGGLLGIVVGRLLSQGAAHMLDFSTIVTSGSVLLAVCVSAAIGLVFGIFPAAKAARKNPIDALRYE
jgi:putative ABC transport system permease protein